MKKERARLTDDEIAIYLSWVHPLEYRQHAVHERQTMGAISRCFGGVRTGDIHAMRWESFDTERGGFQWGWAPRRKTAKPQKLTIPAVLRPVLHAWWVSTQADRGRPVPDPARRQRGPGPEGKSSHASALRRDFKAAMKWATKDEAPPAL